MPRKPQRPRKEADPEQVERFKEIARKIGVDESEGAFDRVFERVKDKARAPTASDGSGDGSSPRSSPKDRS